MVRGWLVSGVVVVGICLLVISTVHPFLAVDHPISADILVVEGWLPDYALEQAMGEFNNNDYRLLVTTGGPLFRGSSLSEYKTFAELAAATLKQLGFDERSIVAVPAPALIQDRTYASAVALRNWLPKSNLSVRTVNVFTLDTHARRTWLIFEETLGDSVAVGIIAADDLSYDLQNWWKSSRGVRSVVDELFAYIYARFFFYPSREEGSVLIQKMSP